MVSLPQGMVLGKELIGKPAKERPITEQEGTELVNEIAGKQEVTKQYWIVV